MKIAIIGTGYVGLVTAAVLTSKGHQVSCLDIDQDKINKLNRGSIPFFEPGLDDLIKKSLKERLITFTTEYSLAIPHVDVIFVCVGTPQQNNGCADLSYIKSAFTSIMQHINHFTIIAIKSTVPVNSHIEIIEELKINENQAEIASCPEFLREGSALSDAFNPDRIIIGVSSNRARNVLLDLFADFDCPKLITDIVSAQVIKYAANSFLATKISFANMIANLCEKIGANGTDVLKGIGYDPRIGDKFLKPGIGFGGSCFPKDLSAFISILKKYEQDSSLLQSTLQINNLQPSLFIRKIKNKLGNLSQHKLTLLGLSFKPETDDIRDSPSIKIINLLLEENVTINVYDPVAIKKVKKIFGDKINYSPSPYKAAAGSDALLLITELLEFTLLDFAKIKNLMRSPNIFDGRNILAKRELEKIGFFYQGVGERLSYEYEDSFLV